MDTGDEAATVPVLEPYWRYHAKSFAYPEPWAFPGKIIRRLLEHVAALEARA